MDIHSLDFYPPHYLDSLKSWGYDTSNKKFTDSLYYSFAKLFTREYQNTVSRRIMDLLIKDSEIRSHISTPGWYDKYIRLNHTTGEELFVANCAPCHSMMRDRVTGCGLLGITQRVPGGDWLKKFISNWEKLYRAGDPYTLKINGGRWFGMTIFESTLSDKELDKIIAFLKNNDAAEDYDVRGINPSAIKTIWDDHFQNTFIATKEFEERMPFIHQTCEEDILQLYLHNLDKNLSSVDSMAAYTKFYHGEMEQQHPILEKYPVHPEFLQFASREDGKVKNNDKNTALLTSYFQKKYAQYSEETAKVQAKYLEEQRKLDEVAATKNKEFRETEEKRIEQNYKEEYKVNLKDAYRQLGITVEIKSTGWKNVDKYVEEATMARTTLNYTDPNSGKKAVIEYNPLTVNVTNCKNYDRTLVYLLPDELSSFMRLENKNDVFEEKVTKLMNYKLICIAYKGDEAFYYSADNVKSGDHTVSLIKTDNATIQNNINKLSKRSQSKAMNDELNYVSFARAEEKRQKKLEEQRVFENKVKKVIFPCMAAVAAYDSAKYESHQ